MRRRLSVALLASTCLRGLGGEAQAQSKGDEAIKVCESQRAPFVQMRARNREIIGGRVVTGALVGALGGALVGNAATQGQSSDTRRTATIAGAFLGGIAGGVDQYLAAKREITQDARELSRLIDTDARGTASRIESMITSINATGDCRQRQIAVWEQRLVATRTEYVRREAARAEALAAAPDDKTRRAVQGANKREAQTDGRVLAQMKTEEALIKAAINDDKALFNDVLQYFENDILAIAEAQARVEGTSTASIRGPAETYVAEVIPPAILASNSGVGSSSSAFGSSSSAFGSPASQPILASTPSAPPLPAAPPVYLQAATQLRATPAPQGVVLASLPLGAAVQNLGATEEAPAWIKVEHGGKIGYVLAARIGVAPPAGAKRPPTATAKAAPPLPPVWQAQVRRPNVKAANGQQAALMAQRDAYAQADAMTLSALGRLEMAVRQGNQVAGPP